MMSILFHRRYLRFQGGHLKIWDYFQHLLQGGVARPQIYFEPDSVWDESNPWLGMRSQALPQWKPEDADALFLGGVDWKSLPESKRADWPRPVINLIQHVRHADPALPLHAFLSHKAIRICVSQEIADAITATGYVNGPVFTIPNGIDLSRLPVRQAEGKREIDVLIAGLKNPEMARKLEEGSVARGLRVRCLTELILRRDFLNYVASSRITIFLPGVTEGFYLPALEGMALGTLVICPDCVGNRSFCKDGVNCLRPRYKIQELADALETALALDRTSVDRMVSAAAETAGLHNIDRERQAFIAIVKQTLAL